jgi:AcrR family transcriptional regulator
LEGRSRRRGRAGVAATSIDDVRRRACAPKSQLYLYFADRDELIRAVAETTCDAVIELQSDALAGFDSIAGTSAISTRPSPFRYTATLTAAARSAPSSRGELRPDADPALLAQQTLAALQGGLLLTQVRRDPGQLRAAADAVLALIRAQLNP